jgi:hypothetical protein
VKRSEGKTGVGLSPVTPPGKQSVLERCAVYGLRRRRGAAEGHRRWDGTCGAEPAQPPNGRLPHVAAPSRGAFLFSTGKQPAPRRSSGTSGAVRAARRVVCSPLRRADSPACLHGARCGVVLRYTAACKATRRVSGCRTLWRRRPGVAAHEGHTACVPQAAVQRNALSATAGAAQS